MTGLLQFFGLIHAGIRDNKLLWLLIAGFALFPIVTHLVDLPFWNDVVMRIMLLGMAAMGLNLVLGYGGMVSFGHAAFIGIGAYCVGIGQFYGLMNGWAHILLSIAVCASLGLVIGYLAL
ncbi:MAG: ABC transporter permease subunit, partial [Candidatus Puniceispirillaceae bacterium]